MRFLTLPLLSPLSFSSALQAQVQQPCPLLGVVFPAPRNPSGASAVQVALSSATDAIHSALLKTTA